MTTHCFNVEIAQKVGVNAAIIYQNICFWIEKNEANKKGFINGYYWTYNTWNAWCELFPYMGKYEIKAALQKLKSDGYIYWETGINKENTWDKTTYYRLVKKDSLDMGKNLTSTEEKTKHVYKDTDINTDINTDIKKTIQKKEIEIVDQHKEQFQIFWENYPNKKSKPTAYKAFLDAIKKTDLETLLRAIQAHKLTKSWTDKNGQFVPMPATWLNQERWTDELNINDVDDLTYINLVLGEN